MTSKNKCERRCNDDDENIFWDVIVGVVIIALAIVAISCICIQLNH